ncbi:hypothetical protein IFR05_000511 [Cadophora sp. M221]|nr:hypothetical protein IFR05_000511 [Cadophora sp. M221]
MLTLLSPTQLFLTYHSLATLTTSCRLEWTLSRQSRLISFIRQHKLRSTGELKAFVDVVIDGGGGVGGDVEEGVGVGSRAGNAGQEYEYDDCGFISGGYQDQASNQHHPRIPPYPRAKQKSHQPDIDMDIQARKSHYLSLIHSLLAIPPGDKRWKTGALKISKNSKGKGKGKHKLKGMRRVEGDGIRDEDKDDGQGDGFDQRGRRTSTSQDSRNRNWKSSLEGKEGSHLDLGGIHDLGSRSRRGSERDIPGRYGSSFGEEQDDNNGHGSDLDGYLYPNLDHVVNHDSDSSHGHISNFAQSGQLNDLQGKLESDIADNNRTIEKQKRVIEKNELRIETLSRDLEELRREASETRKQMRREGKAFWANVVIEAKKVYWRGAKEHGKVLTQAARNIRYPGATLNSVDIEDKREIRNRIGNWEDTEAEAAEGMDRTLRNMNRVVVKSAGF